MQVQKKDKTMYRLSVSSKDGVPPFGPEIPEPAVFEKNDVFRDFLLCKRTFSDCIMRKLLRPEGDKEEN
jgi:hypothetical protein